MPNAYLVSFEDYTHPDGFRYWRAPGGGHIGMLELNGPSHRAIVVYPSPRVIPGAISLGTDIEGQIRLADRQGIASELGLGRALVETRLDRIISELYQAHVSADGSTSWKPVRGKPSSGLVINLGGFGRIIDEPYDSTSELNTIEVFQADYRRNRNMQSTFTAAELKKWNNQFRTPGEFVANDNLDDITAFNRWLISLQKWTGATRRQLQVKATDILPPEFAGDGERVPATTITDDFNRADGELGANWTDDNGDADILSNQWDVTTGEAMSRYSGTSLSTDDHRAQADFADGGQYEGPVIRKVASGTLTFYTSIIRVNKTDLEIFKRIAGSYTELQSDVVDAQVVNDEIKIDADGSTIRHFFKGVQAGSDLTNSDVTGNLQVGLVALGTIAFADNFEAADLAAGAATIIPQIMHHRRQIGVS